MVLPQLCRHVKQHKIPAPPPSYIYPIYCNSGLCAAFHFTPRTENNQYTCRLISLHNKRLSLMYHRSIAMNPCPSIYIHIITMHACVHLPCSVSCSNKLSQQLFRISYASEQGRPITLDPSSVGSSITSPSRTSVSMALSIGISIYKANPNTFRISIIYSHLMPHHENGNNVSIGFHLCLEFLVHKLLACIFYATTR